MKTLQAKLNERGASIAVDGVFGRGTANAVRSLQSAAKIGVDGVVGPQTWNAANSNVRISDGGASRDDNRGPEHRHLGQRKYHRERRPRPDRPPLHVGRLLAVHWHGLLPSDWCTTRTTRPG